MLAAEARFCGVESGGGSAIQSGMQAAGQLHIPFSLPQQALNLMRANNHAVGLRDAMHSAMPSNLQSMLSTADLACHAAFFCANVDIANKPFWGC